MQERLEQSCASSKQEVTGSARSFGVLHGVAGCAQLGAADQLAGAALAQLPHHLG